MPPFVSYECHGQWHDSSYQNKWHMLSSVSLYIMCVMICVSTRDAYHRWCDDTWHDSYQNMWCVPQPVYKHMICITASTMMHAMTYARMSQFASRHVMHVTTHVIMHTITNVIMSHIVSRHMMHVIAHAMTLDVYHGYVIDLQWLVSWHMMHVIAHAMTLDVYHRLAMTCIMTHDACHCPCNGTRCVSWLCHNLSMTCVVTHYACFVFYIFKYVLKINNFYMWYFIFNHSLYLHSYFLFLKIKIFFIL